MKRLLFVVAVTMVLTLVDLSSNEVRAASQLSEINQQLDRVKHEIDEAKQLERKAKQEAEKIQEQKLGYAEQVKQIRAEIDKTSNKLNSLTTQITDIEVNLVFTTQKLKEAEERVADRETLLNNRIKLLYMNGFVSYLDVLLSSSSLLDFLDRLFALQSIIRQDKQLLKLNIMDRQEVENKKQDVEAQLVYVSDLLTQAADIKKQLESKRKGKEIVLASLENKEDQLVEISEKQEKQILQLADEQGRLLKKQAELKTKNNGQKKKIVKYTGGQMTWPVPSSERITSMWGARIHPITKKKQNHNGLDIGAPNGNDIVAAASGTVILAQWYGDFGNCVIIEHENGIRTLYAHIRTGGIKVETGDVVSAGDKIAEIGSTGRSTGNHLHFGVYVNNASVDPLTYLR